MVWGLPALPPYLFSSFVRVHEEFVAHKLVEVIVGGFQTSYSFNSVCSKETNEQLKNINGI